MVMVLIFLVYQQHYDSDATLRENTKENTTALHKISSKKKKKFITSTQEFGIGIRPFLGGIIYAARSNNTI